MIDLRQTPEYAQYMNLLGWKVHKCQMINDKCQIFLKKIPLLGYVAKIQRPKEKINLEKVKEELEKKYKIAAIYFEPQIEQSVPSAFKSAKSVFLPSKTIQIDLRLSETELLKHCKQKTRYNIKLSQQYVVIKKLDDINSFVNLWQKEALSRGQFLSQKKEIKTLYEAFGERANLYFAYPSTISTTPCAGLLIANSTDTAFYMYAFTTKAGRKLFASTALTWHAICNAKKNNLKTFDFDGIYDERFPSQTKAWQGFTKFKEGFGGKTVEFPKPIVYHQNFLVKALI